ncbi:hypothetical protein BD410DRAFT_487283 [Rickenella mellea]|uniref:Uncharacterized protein n=1 Tax=Rickenella mellea TaxID=50990 RepID=A0A4Y7QJZ8_9AGAM|nr:hypothetical protein BD410DRAFT_487283 [Rickenella mellea]
MLLPVSLLNPRFMPLWGYVLTWILPRSQLRRPHRAHVFILPRPSVQEGHILQRTDGSSGLFLPCATSSQCALHSNMSSFSSLPYIKQRYTDEDVKRTRGRPNRTDRSRLLVVALNGVLETPAIPAV